jgi:hypothetical protein
MQYGLCRFDAWLIDKFERLSHKTQKTLGQDCFWLARLCLLVSLLPLFVICYDDASLLRSLLIPILVGAIFFGYISVIEEDTKRGQVKKLANTAKQMWGWRITIIFTFLLVNYMLPQAPLVIFGIFGTCLVYFMSCDPDPLSPSESKAWQWFKSKIDKIREKSAQDPKPAPVPSR